MTAKPKSYFTPAQRRHQAERLEAKIEAAIESGDFIPDQGYLSNVIFSHSGSSVDVKACGCAIAAAAYIHGAEIVDDEWSHLVNQGFDMADLHQLEQGYEGWDGERLFGTAADRKNPFWQVGNRLSRFHPRRDGAVDPRVVE